MKPNKLFCILLNVLLTFLKEGNTNEYCDINPMHTMCQFKGPAEKCGVIVHRGLSPKARQVLLDAHNRVRSIVAQGLENRGNPGPQPPASNMNELAWYDEAERIAQRFTEQCETGHDSVRETPTLSCGQNGVWVHTWTPGSTNKPFAIDNELDFFNQTVQMYVNEVAKMSQNDVAKSTWNYMDTGHYTAAVWGNTSKLGCGFLAHSLDNNLKSNQPF